MAIPPAQRFPSVLRQHAERVLRDWMASQLGAATLRSDLLSETDLREQSRQVLTAVIDALAVDPGDDARDRAFPRRKQPPSSFR